MSDTTRFKCEMDSFVHIDESYRSTYEIAEGFIQWLVDTNQIVKPYKDVYKVKVTSEDDCFPDSVFEQTIDVSIETQIKYVAKANEQG